MLSAGCPAEPGDGTRDNVYKLKHVKFHLNTRRYLLLFLGRGCGVSVREDNLNTLLSYLLKQEVEPGDLRRSLPALIWEFCDDLWFKQ